MKEESKLIELFKKYPGIAARIRRSFAYHYDQILYQMRTKLIILTSIAMALVVMAFPTNKFQPKTVWEHYCKYTLGIHPSQATEDQYDYFLDCWSGDDEYTYLYDYYENKYPEYNHQLKHYGK